MTNPIVTPIISSIIRKSPVVVPPSSPIVSIQNITFVQPSNSLLTWDVELNHPVDLTKTLFFYNADQIFTKYRTCRIVPVDSDTITLTRTGPGAGVTSYITVIEFAAGVVQRGIVTAAATVDIPITEVDLTKAFVSVSGWNQDGTYTIEGPPTIFFTSTTNVRTRGTAFDYIGWQVIEF